MLICGGKSHGNNTESRLCLIPSDVQFNPRRLDVIHGQALVGDLVDQCGRFRNPRFVDLHEVDPTLRERRKVSVIFESKSGYSHWRASIGFSLLKKLPCSLQDPAPTDWVWALCRGRNAPPSSDSWSKHPPALRDCAWNFPHLRVAWEKCCRLREDRESRWGYSTAMRARSVCFQSLHRANRLENEKAQI